MKKIMLLALFTLAGCIDTVHYISFNDKGQTVSSVQIGFASTLLESGDGEELKKKLIGITNNAFSKKIEDANIAETNFIVSNSAIYGVQNRMSAPKHYFAASNQKFFPVKESYGFSLTLGDTFKNSEELEEMQENASEMDAIVAIIFKYRILLSKADLPRPLTKAVLSFPNSPETALPVSDYGVVYMIDVPFNALMEAQKMEFHFAPK